MNTEDIIDVMIAILISVWDVTLNNNRLQVKFKHKIKLDKNAYA
jgi:hypothetical protein